MDVKSYFTSTSAFHKIHGAFYKLILSYSTCQLDGGSGGGGGVLNFALTTSSYKLLFTQFRGLSRADMSETHLGYRGVITNIPKKRS